MTNKDELRALVRAEVDASAARDALTDLAPKRPWHDGLMRHPLFLALVAFALTTFIGGWYDDILKKREDARIAAEQAQQEAERNADLARLDAEKDEKAALEALDRFVALAYQRSVAKDLLRSAIKRRAGEEAISKKAAYDEAYINWNVGLPANLLELRQLHPDAPARAGKRTIYEEAVEASLTSLYSRADNCLTVAYDTARTGDFPDMSDFRHAACANTNGGDWHAAPRAQMKEARTCAFAILSNLSGEIRASTRDRKLKAQGETPPKPAPDMDARIRAELEKSCPGM